MIINLKILSKNNGKSINQNNKKIQNLVKKTTIQKNRKFLYCNSMFQKKKIKGCKKK